MAEQHTDELLSKKEMFALEHEIKQATAKLSKADLQVLINQFLDQVLADPGNPILRAKASITAGVWKGRYGDKNVQESL